jgi:hypothetical protein
MQNLKDIFIIMLMFLSGFIFGVLSAELAVYLLSLPNTIANILGYIIFILTFVAILILGYKIFKHLNK